MPRFVVLLHQTPPGYPRGTHFDLMLERGNVLWTWALDRLPEAGSELLAERLPDHRPVYLDFEGAMGGERGRVSRVEAGEFDVEAESESRLVIDLRGETLRGKLLLEQTESDRHRWRISLTGGEANSAPG